MTAEPPVGAFVRHGERVGKVVGRDQFGVWLRPMGGGFEWPAPPHQVEPIPTADALASALAVGDEEARQ